MKLTEAWGLRAAGRRAAFVPPVLAVEAIERLGPVPLRGRHRACTVARGTPEPLRDRACIGCVTAQVFGDAQRVRDVTEASKIPGDLFDLVQSNCGRRLHRPIVAVYCVRSLYQTGHAP